MPMELPGYERVRRIGRNASLTLYRAVNTLTQQPVLLKVLTSQIPKQEDVSLAVHEYQMTKGLQVDGILQPLQLEKHQHLPVVIFQDFDSILLKDYLTENRPDVAAFLRIAIQLSRTLADLHQHRIIHKDVQPSSILIHPKTGKVKLTGLCISTTLAKENQQYVSPFVLEGTPPYLSPEQTGRMNRSLDYRTDLYSLGVTFYEMLTGKLPFEASDPVEWVHAHIAKKPLPPDKVDHSVPPTVSAIVMKLLEKAPESRYQSAYGLLKDLEECRIRWYHPDQIEAFPLAQEDKTATFEIPQKLYGRSAETNQLYAAFNRVSRGTAELVLIPGVSGIGKTALVGEIQKPLVAEKGYFISGKFDQLQRHVPYAPIIHAFKELIRQILTESEQRIAIWKQAILDGIHPNGQVVVDVLPELEWLIGSQPAVQPLGAMEAQNRFHIVFQQFVHVFTKKEHPLVVFLDDLQWADTGSLNLIHYLLTHTNSSYLLIIGAYRDNEVGLAHPFTLVLDDLLQADVKTTRIPLGPLSLTEVNNWVADALYSPLQRAQSLASIVFQITDGNPFFVHQLLHSLYRDRLITFNVNSGMWEWDPQDVQHASFNQNIVQFMVAKVKKLAARTQRVMKMAACIGNRFDLRTLSIIYEQSPDQTAGHLWEALEEGLIIPLDPAYKWQYPSEAIGMIDGQPPYYRFLHDRVQQAAYMILSTEERKAVHYDIGRLLMENADPNQQEEWIFDIANHLNIGRDRMILPAERNSLAELNRRAGQRAKEAAAFESALSYFTIGLELLPNHRWDSHYSLTMALTLGRGECEYLNSRFQEAEKTFADILLHARSRAEKMNVYSLQITLYTHVDQYRSAVEAGLKGLKLFGWHVPPKPSKLSLVPEIVGARLQLGRRKASDLTKLPKMADSDKRSLMQVMINLNAPSYHFDQNLVSLLMLKAFRYTLKHGNTDISALAYNNYALFLSAGFGDLIGSYEFGRLALKLADESNSTHLKGRVYFVFGSFVNHWKNHIKGNIDYLEWSQQYCIESGNLHLAGAASSFIIISTLIKGNNIADVITRIDEQLDLANRIKLSLSQDFLGQLRHWLYCLTKTDLDPQLETIRTPEDEAAQVPYYTLQLQAAYLFDKPELALRIIAKLELLVDRTLVIVTAPEYYFYHSLWLAKVYEAADAQLQKQYWRTLRRHLKKMKKWAKHCPENFWHKYALMRAEMARIQGHDQEAVVLYEQAIRSATENEYQQNAAIANECTARYYGAKKMITVAKAYMTDAYNGYLKWGAVQKAHALKKHYPQWIEANTHENVDRAETTSLDLQTIMKASRTISGEIVLERLLKRLMVILLENAGAEKGCLILQEEAGLFIEAAGTIEQSTVTVLQSIPALDNVHVSSSIVQYVLRTKEPVVLEDAAREGMFTKDPYIVKHQPKSILCMPVLFQGKLNALLYIENNVTSHAFTPERLKVLSLLSAQAAISIENARLYAHLEKKVQARTQQLKSANDELEKKNAQLARMDQSRRDLLSNISHDLRTPITAVRGYIESILDGVIASPDQQKHYLERSYKRLNALNRMIHDLFDLSQLEAGQMAFSPDIIPVDQLIQQLYQQYELDSRRAGIAFELQLAEPVESVEHEDMGDVVPFEPSTYEKLYPLVEVDPQRIEQAFANLINNAIKHTPKGGTIRVSLVLKTDADSGKCTEVIVKVADSGSGIAAADIPHIFDRFYSSSQSRDGHGLGLAICKEIVSLHQGRIWAESTLGKGATFCFTLPVITVSEVLNR